MTRLRFLAGAVVAIALAVAIAPARAGLFTSVPMARQHPSSNQLQHLIFIVQENRSFDHFFGTFPGADGLPSTPPCLPSQWYPSQCFTPYPDHNASNQGGPYMNPYQVDDIDGGKMDGYVIQREQQLGSKCAPQNGMRVDPRRTVAVTMDEEGTTQNVHCIVDVMGYHTQKDLPNYWSYAQKYVLYDHFYESAESWSLPAHLALFSGWSAQCTKISPPEISSCESSLTGKTWSQATPLPYASPQPYLWTDITYLLYQNNVTWSAYLDGGLGGAIGPPNTAVQGIWIPLGGFETVVQDAQTGNALGSTVTDFITQAGNGTLPQVSWVLPNYNDSDHPQASVKKGQAYVTNLVNAVMKGPDWSTSAIFIIWDDMGGFYDHEPPPFTLDADGPGLRIPAILISPYAIGGTIDHQILTTDSFLKLIEDTFVGGESICQSGRSDPRPDCRDESTQLGNLLNDFNFSQKRLDPLVLSTHPMTTLIDNDEDDSQRPGPRIRRAH
jgi:phospholipase C